MDQAAVKYLFNQVVGHGNQEILDYLARIPEISFQDKVLVFSLASQQYLKDMELPQRIDKYRRATGYSEIDSCQECLPELSLLGMAWNSKQYHRYMKHLLIAFEKPINIFPVSGQDECECAICKRRLSGLSQVSLDSPDLAYSSSETTLGICKHCLYQLKSLDAILNYLDPGYLRKY